MVTPSFNYSPFPISLNIILCHFLPEKLFNMSTIIIAAMLISVIISICFILVSINHKHRQRTASELLRHFSKLGIENNLSFSSQEILENCIIGLDGIQRKLLVLKKIDTDSHDPLLLNLNEVKSCSKTKIFRSVNVATGKKEKFMTQIDKIVLAFDFKDNRQPVHVIFFEAMTNHILAMPELEQKAKNWETILSKIVNTDLRKIA